MKILIKLLLTLFCLILPVMSYAKAILDVMPTSTIVRAIRLAANSSTTITYSVTNNTRAPMNKLTIDAAYQVPLNTLTLNVTSSTCSQPLAGGATCRFNLLVQTNANASSANVVLMPRVCDFASATCSVPIINNRIGVTVGGTGHSVAYIANAGNNLLSICPINVDGSLNTCTTSNGNGTFNGPFSVAVNAAGTAIFVANSNSNTISICNINQDGTGSVGICTISTGNGTFNYPIGDALNPAGTILYVANNGSITPTVSICPVINNNGNYSLSTCSTTTGNGAFTGGSGLQGVTFNADGTYAYFPTSTWVAVCPVLSNGDLDTCRKLTDPTFRLPQGMSFNTSGTYAYIGNYIQSSHSGTVSICPVLQDGSGNLGPCTSSNGNGTFDFFFNDEVELWMSSPTNIGYVPNNGNNTISVCPINMTTFGLDTCSVASGNGTFNQPTSVTLSYVISG
jgi:DNA-binding beta-propeller fold protein YncE